MNETVNNRSCERGNDLISFLYGEAEEANDFEGHLKFCRECQSELASFGYVRQSITVWKEEALGGFVSQPLVTPVRQKSALAALREFFDLSPLWLKCAVGFAAVVLCVMAVALVMSKASVQPAPMQASGSGGRYNEQQLKEAVDQALKQEREKVASVAAVKTPEVVDKENARTAQVKQNKPVNKSTQWVRRSLSRSEREQLAADLRLLSTSDDDSLNLIGEKINQEF